MVSFSFPVVTNFSDMIKSIDIARGCVSSSCLGCSSYLPDIKKDDSGRSLGMCGNKYSMYKLTYCPEYHSCMYFMVLDYRKSLDGITAKAV